MFDFSKLNRQEKIRIKQILTRYGVEYTAKKKTQRLYSYDISSEHLLTVLAIIKDNDNMHVRNIRNWIVRLLKGDYSSSDNIKAT